MSEIELNEQMQIRLSKLTELQTRGVDAFGQRFERTHTSAQIIDHFENLEGRVTRIAGRIMAIRGHGKASFAELADSSGKIQIYIRQDEVGDEQYGLFKLWDIGDLVGVVVEVFRTHRG